MNLDGPTSPGGSTICTGGEFERDRSEFLRFSPTRGTFISFPTSLAVPFTSFELAREFSRSRFTVSQRMSPLLYKE